MPGSVKSISADELERRIESGTAPFMLDLREPEAIANGVIAGSVNIPMGEVQLRIAELPADRDIVVICHFGARSAPTTKKLNAPGYDRVVKLNGGMDAWLRKPREAAR